MSLTPKQKDELCQAVASFLLLNGFIDAHAAFLKQLGPEKVCPTDNDNSLERKWSTLVRLQKKVVELEAQVKKLEACKRNSTSQISGQRINTLHDSHLPQTPHTNELAGHRGPITRILFHPVYPVVISASEDASVKIWDCESGLFERSLKGHASAVLDAALNSAGTILATSSSDLTVKLWDFATSYECVRTLRGHADWVSGICWTAGDERLVSSSRDTTIKIWEGGSGECVATLAGHETWVRRVCAHPVQQVSPDNHPLVVASCGEAAVRLWNLSAGTCLLELKGHQHLVETLVFSRPASVAPLGQLAAATNPSLAAVAVAACGPVDEAAKVGDGGRRRVVVDAVEGGEFLASGSRDKSVRVWRTVSGECIAHLQGHDGWVRDLAFHANGRWLLSVSDDRSLRVWDLTSGRGMRTISDAHAQFVGCVAVHARGTPCASGSIDGLVRLWGCA